MEKDNFETEVIFRIDTTPDFKGTAMAIFPYEINTLGGDVMLYFKVGQHSSGDYYTCIKTSRPAKESEVKELKKELEFIGYNLKVIRKRN